MIDTEVVSLGMIGGHGNYSRWDLLGLHIARRRGRWGRNECRDLWFTYGEQQRGEFVTGLLQNRLLVYCHLSQWWTHD